MTSVQFPATMVTLSEKMSKTMMEDARMAAYEELSKEELLKIKSELEAEFNII